MRQHRTHASRDAKIRPFARKTIVEEKKSVGRAVIAILRVPAHQNGFSEPIQPGASRNTRSATLWRPWLCVPVHVSFCGRARGLAGSRRRRGKSKSP